MEDKGRAQARPFGLCGRVSRAMWVVFAVFCLLASSEWLMSPLAGGFKGLSFVGIGLVAVGLNGRRHWGDWASVLRLALLSVVVLSVPEILVRWGVGHVPANLWTAVLAVVPAMVVLMVAQRNEDADARRLLVPALIGLGGVLLLIPIDLPHTQPGWISFGVLVLSGVLVAAGGVAIHRSLRGFGLPQAVAIFCFANALVLLVAAGFGGWRGEGLRDISWAAGLVAAAEAVLLVALLRGVEPLRLAARFLVVPLLTIVEGYVLLRPDLTARMVMGGALLLVGAGTILFVREITEDESLSLR